MLCFNVVYILYEHDCNCIVYVALYWTHYTILHCSAAVRMRSLRRTSAATTAAVPGVPKATTRAPPDVSIRSSSVSIVSLVWCSSSDSCSGSSDIALIIWISLIYLDLPSITLSLSSIPSPSERDPAAELPGGQRQLLAHLPGEYDAAHCLEHHSTGLRIPSGAAIHVGIFILMMIICCCFC